MADTYTQHYSNFIGVDLSSDPRAVARNRLAYAENMWRDYESEQGEAIETFPGFRRLVRDLGAVHGLFAYRAKSGEEYLIVHAGTRLYSFESEAVAAMDDVYLKEDAALDKVVLEDGDSQGFIFNNNLYILDGKHFVVVSSVTDQSGATSVTASEIDAYVPTTYFDGKPLEQRNMLVDEAYEKILMNEEQYVSAYEDLPSSNSYLIKGTDSLGEFYSEVSSEWNEEHLIINKPEENFRLYVFGNIKSLKKVTIIAKETLTIDASFRNCPNLESFDIVMARDPTDNDDPITVNISSSCFDGNTKLQYINIFCERGTNLVGDREYQGIVERRGLCRKGMWNKNRIYSVTHTETATEIESAVDENYNQYQAVVSRTKKVSINGIDNSIVEKTFILGSVGVSPEICRINFKLKLHPLHFSTIENVKNFHDGNPDYEGTGVEAINGCTKSAVFDGRIFLTGNSALPNTVFYSNRNLTGANDPTYFGAYNYFNDGDGNTPNVDLLSTPSMLMVLKNNTVQDGSVYYHTAAYNEDEYSRDLVPRIYPSTSGAAGIGSAGKTVPGTTACNFLDDPVFLSTRGLEAVGKQTVNLERTLTHRSSNVDRLLITEDLSSASLAEWKGYLVICCNGNFYLADSRQVHQHPDGSYQYEWYYLKGLGCFDEYSGGYEYLRVWPAVDDKGTSLDDCTMIDGTTIGEAFNTYHGNFDGNTGDITVYSAQRPDGRQFYFYAHGNLALEPIDEEKRGVGEFYPARKIVVVGERLFFGTADGDVCVINTDKRGVPDYKDQDFESDRISSRWYSFAGVRYPSICVTRLDDCSKKSLAKGTVPGATVARFKMMPGSHLRANVSLNGRDFKKIGEAFASRYDAGDLRFDNFSFTENEDAIVVLRELTRNWVDKQYSFVSDGFREPFGLYEISYLYTVKGKIRKPFALIERK